jgi:hypothetical protein
MIMMGQRRKTRRDHRSLFGFTLTYAECAFVIGLFVGLAAHDAVTLATSSVIAAIAQRTIEKK